MLAASDIFKWLLDLLVQARLVSNRRLAHLYLAGKLSGEQVRWLNERLRRDRVARKEFARVLVGVVQSR